jgi:hypothetical protein
MICGDSPFAPLPYNLYYTTMATQYGIKKWIDIGNILMNTLRIWSEDIANIPKINKIPHPPQKKKFKSKKTYTPWIFSLPAWKFYFENNMPLFSLYKLGVLIDMCPYSFHFEEFFLKNLICSFVLENHLGFFI